MKKTMKILSLLLTLALTIGVMCGCGGNETVKEKGKYTYWTSLPGSSSQTLESYNDMLMYQELEKRTGIEVEFIHPSIGSTGNEAFQILLTSNNMPDMVEYRWIDYPGGPDRAIEDKVIISLNKYMQESAPNYYSYMEGEKSKDYPLFKVESITQKGNYYGFKNMNIGTYRCFSGLYVRKDLLDKWGLDVPVTIDDWTELFKTAKANGCSKPLTGGSTLFGIAGSNLFNSAWNVGKEFYIDNDRVIFALEKPEYKQYVAQMAEWYKAGYVDKDYITNESNVVQGNMTNGTSVATFGAVGGGMGKLLAAMETKDPNYGLVACPAPVLKDGEVSWFTHGFQAESADPAIAITYSCGKDDEERYKEAMTWCDYLYSDEGIILKSFGVEGETYKKVEQADGSTKYEYTITDPEVYKEFGATSVEAALYHFFRPANSPGFNQHNDYLDGFYPYESQEEALKLWNVNSEEARKHIIPASLTFTEEEATRIAEINNKCRAKLDTAVSRIICNEDSLSTYDSQIKTAKQDGYDELVKIYQAAYDRYLEYIK